MGFSYNVNVLNQKGSPAIYTDTFANRPAPGYAGRLFVSSDTSAIYEDTGTAWTLIANVSSGAGTLQQVTTNGNTSNVGIVISAGGLSTNSLTDTALTSGSVTFAGSGGLISQDNVNLFWDDTNNRLGINTNTPGNSLDVHTSGTTPILALNNTVGSQSAISFLNTSSAKWRIGNTATNTFDVHNFANGLTAISISGTNNAAAFNANILIAQSSTINQLAGYNAISGDSAGIYFFLGTSANRAYFVLNGLTGPQNYTLPNASGTLALTSNLSGYLPLSGGTLTGTLNGTSAIFSGTLAAQTNGSTFGNAATGAYPLVIQANAVSRVIQLKNVAGGTGDIGVNGTSTSLNYAFGTYSTADAFIINDNGSARHTGDLGLQGSVTRNLNFYDSTNNNINVQLQYDQINANTGQLFIKTNNAGTLATRLTISNTGAATFTAAVGSIGLNMNNMSAIGTITGGSIFLPYTAAIGFRNADGSVGYGNIKANTSGDILLNSSAEGFVGINTISPGYALEAVGQIATMGGIAALYIQARDLTSRYAFYASNSTSILLFNTGPGNIGSFANTTGVYTPLSDINKKKDFEDSTIGLNSILNLKPTLYRMISENENSDKHLGFIAQEVKDFIPQAYVENGLDDDKFIGLNYQAITATLVKAMQEQQSIINGLLLRIELLENK
jgi:hypothetical protein